VGALATIIGPLGRATPAADEVSLADFYGDWRGTAAAEAEDYRRLFCLCWLGRTCRLFACWRTEG
jgi:hypothetical protein